MQRVAEGFGEDTAPVIARVLFVGKYVAPPDLVRIMTAERTVRYLYDLVLVDGDGKTAKCLLHPDINVAAERAIIRPGCSLELLRVDVRLDPLDLAARPFPVLITFQINSERDMDLAGAAPLIEAARSREQLASLPLLPGAGREYLPHLALDLLPCAADDLDLGDAWIMGMPLAGRAPWPDEPLPGAAFEGLPPVRSLRETVHKRLGTQSTTVVGRVQDKSPLAFFGQPRGTEQEHPYFFNFFLTDRGLRAKVVVWNALARRCFRSLRNGDVVALVGFRTKLHDGEVELSLNAQRPRAEVYRVAEPDLPRCEPLLPSEPAPLLCTSSLLPHLPGGTRVHAIGLVVRAGPVFREHATPEPVVELIRSALELSSQQQDVADLALAEPEACARLIELRDPHSGTAVTALVASASQARFLFSVAPGRVVHLADMQVASCAATGSANCVLVPTSASAYSVLAHSAAEGGPVDALPSALREGARDVLAWASDAAGAMRIVPGPAVALGIPHPCASSLRPVRSEEEAHALLSRAGLPLPIVQLDELSFVAERLQRFQRVVVLCRVRIRSVAQWPPAFRAQGGPKKRRKTARPRRGAAASSQEASSDDESAAVSAGAWADCASMPPATGFPVEDDGDGGSGADGGRKRDGRRGKGKIGDERARWLAEWTAGERTGGAAHPRPGGAPRRAWVGHVSRGNTAPEPVCALITVSPCTGAAGSSSCLVGVPQRFATGADSEDDAQACTLSALHALAAGVIERAAAGGGGEGEEEEETGPSPIKTRAQRAAAPAAPRAAPKGESQSSEAPTSAATRQQQLEAVIDALQEVEDAAMAVEAWRGDVPQVHLRAMGLFRAHRVQ